MADDARPNPVASTGAEAGEVIRLWPDGAPSSLPRVAEEAEFSRAVGGVMTTMVRNVSDPTLTVFRPVRGAGNGVGVIVCPGGGWRILAFEHEGIDLARWLAQRGYTAFLLKYRLRGTPADPDEYAARAAALATVAAARPPTRAAEAPRSLDFLLPDEEGRKARAVAAEDGRQALAIVRERAADWGLRPDRIGVAGFSAGAFLAVDVAMDPGAASPAFVAAIYGGETSGLPVAADAPPLFTVIAQDDWMLYKVVEGLYADWSNADRPAELHIFAKGGHGFGMARRGMPVDRWTELFEDWLADLGLTKG